MLNLLALTYRLINNIIGSKFFKAERRISEQAFTRNRQLTFPTLMLYLLDPRKQSPPLLAVSGGNIGGRGESLPKVRWTFGKDERPAREGGAGRWGEAWNA